MQIFVSAFVSFILVFPIYLISSAITGSAKRQEKAKQEAINRGHVVSAFLVKRTAYRRNIPGVLSGRARLGIYKYEYKGKTYKYRFWADKPPETLTLYFLKKPSKATVEQAMFNSTVNWPLVYAIVAFVVYLLVRNGSI